MKIGFVPFFAVALLGCAPDFEPASTLGSLRVLAVQKDKPYARPGETVKLTMLVDDASEDAPRPLQILWLGAFCENPPGDLYAQCFQKLLPGVSDGKGPFGLPSSVKIGSGTTFELPLSADIISGRKPPVDPKQPLYGTSYVFFAACAGKLDAAPSGETLPFACYKENGERIDQTGFVAGYTEVFASNVITNANPVVTGFEVDGHRIPLSCSGDTCVPQTVPSGKTPDGGAPLPGEGGVVLDAGVASGADAGAPSSPDAGASADGDPCPPSKDGQPIYDHSPACLAVCTKDKQDDCPKHSIKLIVDPASDEHDSTAEALEGRTVYEQMWINYYTTAGKIPVDVKLLGDTSEGYNEKHDTKLLEPRNDGPFDVWAVAHDNRGGAQWVRVRMGARVGVQPLLP